MVEVGLLGHRSGNIGHDMMALGVEIILRDAFDGQSLNIHHIEEHRQFDIYPKMHPFRLFNRIHYDRADDLKRWINREDISRFFWDFSWVKSLDFGISSGGPYIAPAHYTSGEIGLMTQHMHGAFVHNGLPFFNLSMGSCYPIEHYTDTMTDLDGREFLKRLIATSSVSTVRDELAQRLFKSIGASVPLICCPALLTGRRFREWHQQKNSIFDDEYVIINFQAQGANDDWGQNVDKKRWQDTIQKLIGRLESRHKILMLAHSQIEYDLAEQIAPQHPRYFPKTLDEYAQIIRGATTGVVSRVHAAIPLAGIGVSSILIGTDTRMGTLDNMGIHTVYVKEATPELLEQLLEDRLQSRQSESERLHNLYLETLTKYRNLIHSNLEVS
jgi:hypothetical protein